MTVETPIQVQMPSAHERGSLNRPDFITIAVGLGARDNPAFGRARDYVHFGSDSDSINRGGTLRADGQRCRR